MTPPSCAYSLLSSVDSTVMVVTAVPICMWSAAVVAGTVMSSSPLGVLSLKASFKEMTTGRSSRLNVLDVFRVLAILWVMMNHTGSEGRIDILDRLPSAQEFKKAVHEHWLFGALLGNSALGVEVFLLLSGLLAARSWLKASQSPFCDHYFKYVSRRVFRLFPSVGLFVYIAAGPIMRAVLPRFHNTMISSCGASGIVSHITFLGNWQDTPTCLGYLWYIGLDMQLHMVAPLFLHALSCRARVAVPLVVIVIFVSAALRAAYCITYGVCNKSDVDIPFISYAGMDVNEMKSVYLGLWEMYARPYTKCGPFLIGLLFGWASASWEQRGYRISNRLGMTLFISGTLLAILTIYGILPEYWYPEMTTNVYNVTYTAFFRSVFAVALVLMITGLTQRVQLFTVNGVWSILARLTFSAYLVHMPVVYIFNHLDYLQQSNSAITLVIVLPMVAAVSFAFATPFYLFVESPIGRLVSSWDAYVKRNSASSSITSTSPKVSLEGGLLSDVHDHDNLLPLCEKR